MCRTDRWIAGAVCCVCVTVFVCVYMWRPAIVTQSPSGRGKKGGRTRAVHHQPGNSRGGKRDGLGAGVLGDVAASLGSNHSIQHRHPHSPLDQSHRQTIPYPYSRYYCTLVTEPRHSLFLSIPRSISTPLPSRPSRLTLARSFASQQNKNKNPSLACKPDNRFPSTQPGQIEIVSSNLPNLPSPPRLIIDILHTLYLRLPSYDAVLRAVDILQRTTIK